jgi:sugar (pentulose or hexulose) kinase
VERAVFEVIRRVAERFELPRAIGVCSMAESGFLVGRSGEPLARRWPGSTGVRRRRARWKERLDPLELFTRTGLHLSPRPSACKLEWYRENTPEAGAWLGMAEYLGFRMTGQKGTDPSLAGRTNHTPTACRANKLSTNDCTRRCSGHRAKSSEACLAPNNPRKGPRTSYDAEDLGRRGIET